VFQKSLYTVQELKIAMQTEMECISTATLYTALHNFINFKVGTVNMFQFKKPFPKYVERSVRILCYYVQQSN